MAELSNAQIADALEELGDLYELDGAIVHRVVAYRTAAKTVRESSTSVAALTRAGRVTELPGLGRTLEEKITSACIACHTKETAKAHVETLTAANGQESCVVCHGVGREFAVEKVHRR